MLDAVSAVKQYADADILLVSWPPLEDETINSVCVEWGTKRPIVYIGEGEGGCNAPESFWQRFWVWRDAPEIELMSWEGIHDHVHIGYWRRQREGEE